MRKRFLPGFLAVIVASVWSSAQALEVIVDNNDPGCAIVGTWSTATTNCYGANKRYKVAGDGSASATYTTNLPAGWYRVDFYVNSNTGYTTDAQYLVTHRDGVENCVVSQRQGSSGWYVVGGAYYFDNEATVTLTDEYYSSGSRVQADAIRFRSVFSFVQMSDSHVGYSMGTSDATLVAGELRTLGKVAMAGYGFDAPPPSFAIHTGDFTEYGAEYWNTLQGIFSGMPFPIYYTSGNHDQTWNSCREKIRSIHGAPFYSFDHYDRGTRFHFVGLNSGIIQSPRAGFAREELDWLENDLAAAGTNTWSFLFLHHPIDGASDPKPYDAYNLLDRIRPFNANYIFYGHGHNFSQTSFDGTRLVQGGSTYDAAGNRRGYNIVTVSHDRVHIAKKQYGVAAAETGILNNALLPAAPSYGSVSVSSPIRDFVYTGASLDVVTTMTSGGTVTAADFELDGDNSWRALAQNAQGSYAGTLGVTGMTHGRHWVRVRVTMASGGPWYRTVPFWVWDAYPKPRWILDLASASLGAPAVADGKVYIGTNGGSMRCVDALYGTPLWRVVLPSDVISSPAVADGKVVFGCGDGKVYCLNTGTGVQVWAKSVSGPCYSPPLIDGSTVFIGSNGTGPTGSSYLYSLRLSDGGENWKFPTSCSIESKPCVTADTVFVGAWDSYFYAVNRSSGTQRWRYQRNASRYYSPGDSWPVVAPSANRVFVADREYYLNAINITTGASDWTRTGVASQALTPDGSTLLLRNTAGTLEKATFDNGTAWTASCSLDSAPVAPSAAGSHAAVVDQDGLVSVVNVANGAIRYQFQAARGYQLNPVSVDSEGCAYLTTYEGFLLCIASQDPPAKAVADIVVDSRTAGGGQTPNPTYAESGSWMDSTAKSVAVGSAGSGSRFALFSDGTPGTASATPNLAATGSYDVYATWNTSSNARGVTYAVRHRDGITSVVLDQKPAGAAAGTNSHVWNWLGRFSFGAGQNSATGSVTVDETFVTGPFSAYNTGRTYADGFLWVYAGPASNIECWREITGD